MFEKKKKLKKNLVSLLNVATQGLFVAQNVFHKLNITNLLSNELKENKCEKRTTIFDKSSEFSL